LPSVVEPPILRGAMPAGDTFSELVAVMTRLLAPDGCPWDREQTLASLRRYLIEETYEVIDAIDAGDPAGHAEELGDLLMQIVFQSALRAAEGRFTIDDVVRGIVAKLIRRHPHVFGDKKLDTSGQVLDQWRDLKSKEKVRRTLDGVPRALPALARARELSARAAHVGFDWPDPAGSRAKIDEELGEVDQALTTGHKEKIAHEIGDLLFAVVNLARKLDVDPEGALRATADKFSARFAHIEDRLGERGKSPKQSDLVEMDALWDEAKLLERAGVTEK
jgi:MazG family protein